jgi:hypothetical protein
MCWHGTAHSLLAHSCMHMHACMHTCTHMNLSQPVVWLPPFFARSECSIGIRMWFAWWEGVRLGSCAGNAGLGGVDAGSAWLAGPSHIGATTLASYPEKVGRRVARQETIPMPDEADDDVSSLPAGPRPGCWWWCVQGPWRASCRLLPGSATPSPSSHRWRLPRPLSRAALGWGCWPCGWQGWR